MEINMSDERQNYITNEWEDIGIQLDVADKKLEDIREKHTRRVEGYQCLDCGQAFRDMIRVWAKQDNPPPTWSNFTKAIESFNRFQKLSDQLRSNYGTCIVQYQGFI
jgi:hypothetical protein